MAKNKKDKYAKINGIVNETVEYCLGYILKFPNQIAESIQSKGGIGSIEEKKFSIPNSKNGNISLLQDLSILTQKAIDEYVRLYDKGLKNSKTWMSQTVLTKPQSSCQIDFKAKEINEFIDKTVLTDDTSNKNFKNIKNFISILDEAFGKTNVSKLSNAKFYKLIKDTKSELSNIVIEKIEDAEIDEIPESIKTPVCISNDGSIGEKSSMVDGRELEDVLNCLSTEDKKTLEIKAEKEAEHKEELSENDSKLLLDMIQHEKATYDEWKEKNKNDKTDVISILDKMLEENSDEENEEDVFGELKVSEILDKIVIEGDKVLFTKDDKNKIELDKDKAEQLKKKLEENEKEYNEWKEKHKEDKKEEIAKLNNLMGNENSAEEPPKNVEQAVDAAANATIHSAEHIDDKNFGEIYKKTKENINKALDVVAKWTETNDTVDSMFDKLNKGLGDLADTTIGQMWIMNSLINIKDILGEAIRRKMLLKLITEADEQNANQQTNNAASSNSTNDNKNTNNGNENTGNDTADKNEDENKKEAQIETIKKLITNVDDILSTKEPPKFKAAYEKWAAEVKKIVDAMTKSETYKDKVDDITKSKDPYEQICLCYKLLTDENKEEQPNKTPDKNDVERNIESEDGYGADEVEESFHVSFQKVLKNVIADKLL